MTTEDHLALPLDESLGPAAPISTERSAAIIAAAIDEAHREKNVRRLRPRRRLWIAALAAALALAMGTAFAALLPRVFGSRTEAPVAPPSQPSTPVATIAETSAMAPPVVATSEPEPAVTAAPSVTAKEAALPADLLRTANEQRTQRKWSDAESTYEHVMSRSPHSSEAYAASVAAASIRLEHLHDAAGALRLYQAAIAERPNGSLSEEARFGIAEAKRALGDRPGEIEALRAFVANHPDALMRPNADARLRELHAK